MSRLIVLLLLCLISADVPAQDVYNFMLERATTTLNSPTASFTQIRIAQFKRTALTYLNRKAHETRPAVTVDFLNTQAYYLSEFLTLYLNEIIRDRKDSEALREAKIDLFMKCSREHPLFYDPDEETTLAFVKEGTELTPFSLDTDWEEAFQAAKAIAKEFNKLKKELKK